MQNDIVKQPQNSPAAASAKPPAKPDAPQQPVAVDAVKPKEVVAEKKPEEKPTEQKQATPQPKKPKGPGIAITFAVIVFLVLAGLAVASQLM